MPSIQYDFTDLIAVQDIIRDAAASSLDIHFACSTADYKADGSIVTEADLAMQQTLTKALAERYPQVAMLGEEVEPSTAAVVPMGVATAARARVQTQRSDSQQRASRESHEVGQHGEAIASLG